ncbi:MAG: Tetracycline resistance protein, class C [Candidatus Heimdallarchaeota archaeon LC_2]|nr:MAG: Tetracycline resistance protein, class C [Candidatus Heimdallarchaeota archaeon LC_2]
MTKWRQLSPILVINFITTLSFSLVLPFLIVLVLDFGGNALIYGLLGASFSLFQLIASPILGSWSDKKGRRPILLLSHVGTMISWVGLLIAVSISVTELTSINNNIIGAVMITVPLVILFLSRIFDGMTGGAVSVANAYLADISSEEDLAKNYGYMAVAANLGFVVGPTMSGLLSNTSFGLKLPIIIALGIGLIGFFMIFFFLDEDISTPSKVNSEESKPKSKSFRDVLKIPHVSILLLLNFLIFLAFNFFYVSFPVYALGPDLGWSLTQLGLFYSGFGLTMAITQGPILSYASKRYSEGFLIILGSIILGAGFAAAAIGNNIAIVACVLLVSVGNGISYPSLLALIASHGKGNDQGRIQGVASSFGSVASILGLISGGLLFESIGKNIFFISAIIMLLVTLLSIKFAIMEEGHSEYRIHHQANHTFLGSHHLHHIVHKKHENVQVE